MELSAFLGAEKGVGLAALPTCSWLVWGITEWELLQQ